MALLHYQWPLQSVAEAAGGMEEMPAESSWRPMQVCGFSCTLDLPLASCGQGHPPCVALCTTQRVCL